MHVWYAQVTRYKDYVEKLNDSRERLMQENKRLREVLDEFTRDKIEVPYFVRLIPC